jgi:enoyl-CoA hydratase/carnithine racemase
MVNSMKRLGESRLGVTKQTVHRKHGKRTALSGNDERVTVQTALRIGLVTEVRPERPDRVRPAGRAAARDL